MIKLRLDNIFIEILYKSLGDQMGILNLVSEIDFSGLAKNQVGEGAHLVQPVSVVEGQQSRSVITTGQHHGEVQIFEQNLSIIDEVGRGAGVEQIDDLNVGFLRVDVDLLVDLKAAVKRVHFG